MYLDADFFQPDRVYIAHAPYRAPELVEVFWCKAVTEHPKDGTLRAFGFKSTLLAVRYGNWWSAAWQDRHFGREDWEEYTPAAWEDFQRRRYEAEPEQKPEPVVYPADLIHRRESS